MDLQTFNAASRDAAIAALRPCADIPEWLAAVADARPYPTTRELWQRAAEAAKKWRVDDVDAALATHPRIGETATGAAAESRLSRAEQPQADPDTAALLAAGNAAYENRFGRIFLVRAAGRTARDILASLTERLGNPVDVEDAVVIEQLREIALLRLTGRITP